MKYTKQELIDNKIAIRCDSQEEADRVFDYFKGEVNDYSKNYYVYDVEMKFFISNYHLEAIYSNKTVIPASEFFMEDDAEEKPTENDHIADTSKKGQRVFDVDDDQELFTNSEIKEKFNSWSKSDFDTAVGMALFNIQALLKCNPNK